MFIHNLKYTLKILLKNKSLIFWTLAFPLILSTLFYLAFSNIENTEKFRNIEIAIVNNDEFLNNEFYSNVFKSFDTDDSLLNIKYVDEKTANKLLEDKKISAYLVYEKNLKVYVNENGINQTIIKNVIEQIQINEKLISKMVLSKMDSVKNQSEILLLYKKVIDEVVSFNYPLSDKSNKNMSYIVMEFYSLLAMAAMYGGSISMYIVNRSSSKLSNVGKRVETSPVKKSNYVMSGVLSALMIQIINLSIFFLYTNIVLNISYGSYIFYIILLLLLSAIFGIIFGIFIAVIFNVKEDTKIGILIAITMFLSVLSGMMGLDIKYLVDNNISIINSINPISMITEGFYVLYYYDTLDKYWLYLISLSLLSAFLFLCSIIKLRRNKYDSI